MYSLGVAKEEMTYFKLGVPMFGYGRFEHQALGVDIPLFSRAFVIEKDHLLTAIVCIEIQTCTIALKKAVLNELQNHFGKEIFNNVNLSITGNHTHSAAGGYSHYPFYNFSSGGFCPGVFNTYVKAITKSVIGAYSGRFEGELELQKGSFSPLVPVVYNRSLKPYLQNPENTKLKDTQEHLAVNREMVQLVFKDKQAQLKGLINWFGVHTTSVGPLNYKISGDSKGYASATLEHEYPGAIIAFAQEACGDMSPNYSYAKVEVKNNFKKAKNGFEKARENGRYQSDLSINILKENKGLLLSDSLDMHFNFVNLTNVKVSQKYAYGSSDRSGPGALGMSFFKGTVDGRGAVGVLGFVLENLTRFMNFIQKLALPFSTESTQERKKLLLKTHGVKNVFMETSSGRVLGSKNLAVLPKGVDQTVDVMRAHYKNGSLDGYPLTPNIVPLQVFKIGQLALISMPGEITITAAKRIKHMVKKELQGVDEVVLQSYSNAYCGYVTTPEEYQLQNYEAGHTLYGEQALGAYQTGFENLVKEMNKPLKDRKFTSLKPLAFPNEVLLKRTNKRFAE